MSKYKCVFMALSQYHPTVHIWDEKKIEIGYRTVCGQVAKREKAILFDDEEAAEIHESHICYRCSKVLRETEVPSKG